MKRNRDKRMWGRKVYKRMNPRKVEISMMWKDSDDTGISCIIRLIFGEHICRTHSLSFSRPRYFNRFLRVWFRFRGWRFWSFMFGFLLDRHAVLDRHAIDVFFLHWFTVDTLFYWFTIDILFHWFTVKVLLQNRFTIH